MAASNRTRKTLPRGPMPWWGDRGPAPHKRWPGVTIEIESKWNAKRARWESPDGRFCFDREDAQKASDFFPTFLKHHKGEFADQPFELLEYQRLLIVRPLFGWKRVSDGFRRFRKVFNFVPKGNGKSPLSSGTNLYLLLCDDEQGAEVYAAAADKDQARIVFDTAKIMVEGDETLASMARVLRNVIEVPATKSYFRVLSADVATKHGLNVHGLGFDELHAQPSRELYETLERGIVKRRQPVVFMQSTAGDDEETICYEEYEYAKRVISGTFKDDAYLPVVFEAGPKDDWTDPKVWARVNPGLGVTVKLDAIESECTAASNEPRKRNDFLRYHLNRWVNQATSWIPVEWWDKCKGTMDDTHLQTLRCAAGLDLAQKIDLAAFVVVFQEFLEGQAISVEVATEDEAGVAHKVERSLNYRLYALPFFWLPEETVRDREREGFDSYRAWAKDGLLTITEGASIDYDRVFRDITEKIAPRFPLLKQGEIGYDPAFATDIAARLRDKAGYVTAEVLQNYKFMTEPCHIFEALVKEKRFVHNGNRLLRWNVENVAVKHDDAGRIRPVKTRKRAKKIDGLVATLMATQRLTTMEAHDGPSIYENAEERPHGFLEV